MRRGSATYVVAGLVTMGLVLLVTILVTLSIRDVWFKTESSARCASEVRAHATAVRFTSDLHAPKLICPTEKLEPGNDVRETLANAMLSCWEIWGRGELQLFGDDVEEYCHVCSVVTTDEPIENFGSYLDNQGPRVLGPTYAQLLVGKKKGEFFQSKEAPDSTTVLPAGQIGVIFYYGKNQDNWDGAYNFLLGKPYQGAAVGGTTGAATAGILVFAAIGSGGTLVAAAIVGGVVGAGVGFFTSFFGREDFDTLAVTVVRSLEFEDISNLGCTYAPVANG